MRLLNTVFNKNLVTNNNEKIEDYFLNMNREQLKTFYEKNKNSKICLHLICHILIYSIEKKGLKIFENKGIKIDEKTQICAFQ